MSRLSFKDRVKLRADKSKMLRRSYFSTLRGMSVMWTVSPALARCIIEMRAPTPIELRQAFESMGVTYIKLGQFIGSSPSLFPAEYVEAFQDCFDRTPSQDFALIQRVIEQELDRPLDSVFSSIDEKPLASASIAQVHAATLKSGEHVVIKVQKPGVEATIDVDLTILMLVTKVLELVTPNVNRAMFSGFVEAIYPYMMDECDFVKEENYLIEFDRFIREHGYSNIAVPRPYPNLCTKRVLVMERFYGQTFSEWLRENQGGLDSVDFERAPAMVHVADAEVFAAAVASVKQVWLASLFNHWFFHADLHLGNMMLLSNGQVGLIDFGLVGSIDRKVWHACQKLFIGVIQDDSREIANALFTIGMTKQKIDVDLFAQDIDTLLKGVKDIDAHMSGDKTSWTAYSAASSFDENVFNRDVNRWLIELGTISRSYGLVFPHAFTLLLKQFLYFDRFERFDSSDAALFDMVGAAFERNSFDMETFSG